MSRIASLTVLLVLALPAAVVVEAQEDIDVEREALDQATERLRQLELQLAQEASAQEQRQREQEALLREQERAAAQARAVAQNGAADDRATREAELAQARRQLEDARRELERAARNVAISVVPANSTIVRTGAGSDGVRDDVFVNLAPVPAPPGAPQSVIIHSDANTPGNYTFLRSLNLAQATWGDMELVPMTEGLSRYFGTSEGLLVVRGPEDDGIEIQDGDVILAISGRTPNSPEHAIRILSSFEPGETIEFALMRDRLRETVDYVVPEAESQFEPLIFERPLDSFREPRVLDSP
jgi:hypothetical protein